MAKNAAGARDQLEMHCEADLWCRKRTSVSTMLDPTLFELYMTGDDRIDEDWIVQTNPPCAFKVEFKEGCDTLFELLQIDPGLHATKGKLFFTTHGPLADSARETYLKKMAVIVRTAERELKKPVYNGFILKEDDRMLKSISQLFKIQTADAHCDVPCGVYDPATAALAAKTVAVLAKKIVDLPAPAATAAAPEQKAFENTITRMVVVKEEHAQICKKELLILWSDFFKPQHLEMFPDLHTTFWNAAKLCSFNKQNVDVAKAEELQAACAKVADMFAKAQAAAKK